MTGFENQIPGGHEPRKESRGEAQIRWADWICKALWYVGVRVHSYERDGLATFIGAILRRWPWVGK